ncbi:MAG: hypothetical protein HUU21_00605 [Polyangiaceae bacterium]|nr:hypothetical protein [Polyangiaceae bacterium]
MKRELRLFDELDRFAAGGEISHALALSFGYDGDVANERIWTPLIEKYGVRHPLVIADGVVDAGTALGVHVLRARRLSGVFHAKLFLAIREDAVFTAIGSANLTRGGLGANLELMTPLVFAGGTERPPPRAVLASILAFVDRVVAHIKSWVAESSRGKALEVLQLATLVLQNLPEPRRAPDLRFLDSYEAPIWTQLRAMHGDDPVNHLAVISPFFEVDDPELDESDSLLRHALGDGLPWATRAKSPRCTLHTGALSPIMPLPRLALEELGTAVEVRPQALSVEPRHLHGKLVAIFGKRRTTLLWGSPNFSPAALLRTAANGNVECALAISMSAASAEVEEVLDELDLGATFHIHKGPLPEEQPMPLRPPPIFDIGEALYDPATRVLAVYGEVWSTAARRIRVRLDIKGDSPVLLDGEVVRIGSFSFELNAGQLEEEDPETGRRRLRTLTLLAEALDADGGVLDQRKVRLNIRFDDAIEVRGNLLLGIEAMTADALLVPSSAPPEQRVAAIDRQIALWKAMRRGDRAIVPGHQASLDAFFRNVRRGLDARWAGLEHRRGSRFALLRWSQELRRALGIAAAGSLDALRRAYLVARISEHAEHVLNAIPLWHGDPAPAYAVLEAEKLAEALESVLFEGGAREETTAEVRAAQGHIVEELRRIAAGSPPPKPDPKHSKPGGASGSKKRDRKGGASG